MSDGEGRRERKEVKGRHRRRGRMSNGKRMRGRKGEGCKGGGKEGKMKGRKM